MKIKVSEAEGEVLNWLVARALGKRPSLFILQQTGKLASEHNYSTDWALGGPIIEREKISIFQTEGICNACFIGEKSVNGPTPLIAAMRCYVVSKLGDEVEVPEELQTPT
jgi:hypothetical protein